MKSWPLAVFCLACLATAGCRTHPTVTLLEQENRELEDRIYELADLAEDYNRQNATLREQLHRLQSGSRDQAESSPSLQFPQPAGAANQQDSDFSEFLSEPEAPAVEVPSASISGEEFLERFTNRIDSGALPAPPNSPQDDAPTWSPPLEETGAEQHRGPEVDESVPCTADNTLVAAVTLHERLTGGYNLDGRAGHDGIIAVVEPRDAQGQLLAAAAPMSVVALDPALPGEAARVARWNFTAAEVAGRYRRSPLSEGIHLEMTWPAALPVHSRLHLFVRYTTDDGRKLEADKTIEIDVPTMQAQRPLAAAPARRPQVPTITGGRQPAPGWQQTPSPVIELPVTEPARTARVPAEPAARTAESPQSSPQPSLPKRQPPAWSPDRP